jgi:hypothetical protein
MGVYAQHAKFFNTIDQNICPRQAFLDDLQQEIVKLQELGHHIILMLDGNEDMRHGPMQRLFQSLQLREVILERHGQRAPSTYKRNTNDVPIDGIWASLSVQISAGGYFGFDEIIEGTDHRALWIDLTYKIAFGCDKYSPIIRPSARRLNTQNPNTMNNFNKKRNQYAERFQLGERIIKLEQSIQGPLNINQIKEYEAIDRLRMHHAKLAEAKCRKLRYGNVAYSPTLQQAREKIAGWSLLLRLKQGHRISSRKLARTLTKANIAIQSKLLTLLNIKDELVAATKKYYELKKSAVQLRETHLSHLATVMAAQGNLQKETIIKQLRLREQQRNTARRIKHLRGRLTRTATTTVTIKDKSGVNIDISDKKEMEKAIINTNKKNSNNLFRQTSTNIPTTNYSAIKA